MPEPVRCEALYSWAGMVPGPVQKPKKNPFISQCVLEPRHAGPHLAWHPEAQLEARWS